MREVLKSVSNRIASLAKLAVAKYQVHSAERLVKQCESLIAYAEREKREAECAYALSLTIKANAKRKVDALMNGS